MANNTNAQRLSSLITAALGTGGDAGASTRYKGWTFIADAANTADLYIGDAGVSSTDYGIALSAGDSWSIGEGNQQNNETTESYWVRSGTGQQKINFTGYIA